VHFGSVELSGNGHRCFILASMALMSVSNLSIEMTSLQDEGHGGERYCMLPLTAQFGLVELSGNGHHWLILASIASMSASNLSIETTLLHDEGHG